MNPYTIIGLYEDGSDNTFVDHVEASDPESAEQKVIQHLGGSSPFRTPIRVIAIIPGHHQDVSGVRQ